jgi:hypothetical protein
MIAVKKAAITRRIANGNPIIEYVAKIESTPVEGVEIKKETVAPRLAPSFRRAIAVGITPQEQIGRGIPKSVAQRTDLKLGFEILGR